MAAACLSQQGLPCLCIAHCLTRRATLGFLRMVSLGQRLPTAPCFDLAFHQGSSLWERVAPHSLLWTPRTILSKFLFSVRDQPVNVLYIDCTGASVSLGGGRDFCEEEKWKSREIRIRYFWKYMEYVTLGPELNLTQRSPHPPPFVLVS